MKDNKINWIRKLTSRKFWAAVVSVVLCVCVMFNVNSEMQEQIAALIMSCATLISYIFAEGFVDAKQTETENPDEYEYDDEEDE